MLINVVPEKLHRYCSSWGTESKNQTERKGSVLNKKRAFVLTKNKKNRCHFTFIKWTSNSSSCRLFVSLDPHIAINMRHDYF